MSDNHHIVQDLSFPRNDPAHWSVNKHINIDDFRCDWGTFNNVRTIVMDASDRTEAATLDVDSAFRCCPIIPSQQPNFVIHWNNLFYINHNVPFGATSSGGVFRKVAKAMLAILLSFVPQRIGLMTSYSLDFPLHLIHPLFPICYWTSMMWPLVLVGPGKTQRLTPSPVTTLNYYLIVACTCIWYWQAINSLQLFY